ncbi:MAG: hypothetical protein GY917_17020, partial [Planctomycetaceae bacterium]|nr:hypothetical protein [Planctomycetaceae bacterium]
MPRITPARATPFSRRDFLQAGLAMATIPQVLTAQDKPGSKPQRTADTDIREALTKVPLSMLFKGSTPAEFRSWKEKFSTRLDQLLGDSSPPSQWTIKEESRQELSDHTRLELLLQSPGIAPLPVYLLLPST